MQFSNRVVNVNKILKFNTRLFSTRIRTRYAPSPTGYLHLGGLRTALFNYAFAKHNNGDFLLRIEDTDQSRLVKDSVKQITDCLELFHLKPDEGPNTNGSYGPYIQSERLPIYHKYIQELLDKDLAYYCFCSHERLELMRRNQESKKNKSLTIYDKHCRYLSKTEISEKLKQGIPYVIRMKVPDSGNIIVNDLLKGKIMFDHNVIDDQILLKSDKFPTYHFASVVDDHLMEISHVIRGEEWLSSTPKHILLYQMFGWKIPRFIHLPILLNKNKTKLSKRQGDVSVTSYIEKGATTDSLLHFVSLLGWTPKDYKNELLFLDDIIKRFDLNDLNKNNPVVDIKKLNNITKLHIQSILKSNDNEKIYSLILPSYMKIKEKYNIISSKEYCISVMKSTEGKVHNMNDIYDVVLPYFVNLNKETKLTYNENEIQLLKDFLDIISKCEENLWSLELINTIFDQLTSKQYTKPVIYHALRKALMNERKGANITQFLYVIGKLEIVNRLKTNAF